MKERDLAIRDEALDYIDIMAVTNYKGKDKDLLAVKDKIVHLVKSKDTYPLTPRYKPDQYSVKDPDINQVARFRTMLDEQAKFINEVYIPYQSGAL